MPGIVIKEEIEKRDWPVKYGIGKTVVMTSFRVGVVNEFYHNLCFFCLLGCHAVQL